MYNILKIAAKIQADIFWIPSHVGIDGNDKADDLAKKGTLSTSTIQNKIRYTDAIQTFRNEMEKNTQKWFINVSSPYPTPHPYNGNHIDHRKRNADLVFGILKRMENNDTNYSQN